MKNRSKALLLALCALMLVVTTVFTTLAYLTDTESVTNTFTIGNVAITLDETKVDANGDPATPATRVSDDQSYKLVPNKTYTKDPVVTVLANSEAAYVFVKVENNIAAIEADSNPIATQITTTNGWTELESGVYYKTVNTSAVDQPLTVFSSVTIDGDVDEQGLTAEQAWDALEAEYPAA